MTILIQKNDMHPGEVISSKALHERTKKHGFVNVTIYATGKNDIERLLKALRIAGIENEEVTLNPSDMF